MSSPFSQFPNSARPLNVPADLASPYGRGPATPNKGPGLPQEVPIYLPENFPIPSAVEFNPLAKKTTAVAESGIDIGLILTIPERSLGILRGVSLYITNMLDTTNVTWSVLQNGAVIPGYSNLSIFPRVAPFVSNGFDAFFRLGQGPVTVVYNNIDGGTYTVGAALSGWFWPQSLGDLWLQQGEPL